MSIQWRAKWDRIDALMQLIIDSKSLASKNLSDASLRTMIEQAFLDNPTALNQAFEFKQENLTLRNAIYKIRDRMLKLRLTENHKMFGILWARMTLESGVCLCKTVDQELDRWKRLRQSELKPVRFKFRKVDGNKVSGSVKKRDENFKAIGFDTLTVLELLTAKREKLDRWPYTYKFVKLEEKATKESETPTPMTHLAPRKKDAIDVGASVESKVVKTEKVRSRRTLRDVQRACGSHVIVELGKCLTSESKLSNSVLQLKGRNRRPFNSEFSLDELIKTLKRKHKSLRQCSDSTLKSAMTHFVSCPRGRPAGISR